MHLNPVSQNSYSFQPEACWNLKPSFQGLIQLVSSKLEPGCKQFTFGFTQLQPKKALEASHISSHNDAQCLSAFFCSRDINDHKSMHGMQCTEITDPRRLRSCPRKTNDARRTSTQSRQYHVVLIYIYCIHFHLVIWMPCNIGFNIIKQRFQHH